MLGKFLTFTTEYNHTGRNTSNLAKVLALINFLNSNRDADDAVYARDGYDYDGYKLRVEFPRGGGGSFRGNRDRGGYRGDRRPGPPARRSQYRVMVTGMLKKN